MNRAGQEAIRYILDTHIMFSVLPNREKLHLQPMLEIRKYKEGELLAKQGTPTDGMYIFYSGKARLKQRADGKLTSIGLVEQEATLGEVSLFREAEWPYDVVTIEPATVIYLSAEKTRALLAQNKVVEQHFKANVGLVEVSTRLRAMLGKVEYTQEEFAKILRELGVKRIPKGKPVFAQGDQDPRLYYLERGAVELVRAPLDGDPIVLDRVHKGALIGEAGVFAREGIQPHTAMALTDTTVLVIRHEAVKRLFEINPLLEERLRVRSVELEAYEQEEQQMRKRAEGVDLRVKLDSFSEDEYKHLEKKQEISKFPLVQQTAESECSAACIAMVCKHYGKDFSQGQIRELTSLDGEMITPDQVIKAAETIGFRAKGYSISFEQLRKVPLPGIIGWQGYHWVVLFKVTDRDVYIADPSGGIKRVKKKEFLESWTAAKVAGVDHPVADSGVLIAMEPTAIFERKEEPKAPIMHFVGYVWPYKKFFGEAMIAALTINLLGLATPLFIQTIVDTVVVHQDVSLLNMMLGGMMLVTLTTTATSVVQSLLLAHTTVRIDMKLMSEFYRHVLSLPMSFFMTRNKGEILARFGENQKIRAIITGSTITTLLNMLMVVIYFLMMFGYSSSLTIVVVVFLPVYIAIVTYFTPRIKRIAQEIFLTNSQAQAYLIESLNGIEAIKATANEYFARARWENAFAENVNRGFHQSKLGLMSNSLFKLATTASTIAVLWLGANEVMSGTMTIGELMGFNMLMGLVTAPVLQMVNLWNDIQEVRISVDRVGDVLSVEAERPLPKPEALPTTLAGVRGEIVFDKVNFSYTAKEQTKYIMRDFDLVIPSGTRVGFVGPSGCGKSTCAKVILGFNMPQSGQCLIDGKDVRTLELDSLRRNIGVVLQDSFIFSGTVAENIALGEPEPDMQKVKEASRLAGADEFIVNYPLGYQTPIGEKGMGISGGQRQRICIARALYHKPKIMIFDEATSALDNQSEARIIEQMKTILHNRTSIAIAHRLSTLADSDLICYINDGKVREMGSPSELLDPEFLVTRGFQGSYYGLAQSQFDLAPLNLDEVRQKMESRTVAQVPAGVAAAAATGETDESKPEEPKPEEPKPEEPKSEAPKTEPPGGGPLA